MRALVGRDNERRIVETAMAGPPPWSVVIDGAAGIGKTELWHQCLASVDADKRVLVTRATQAETAFGFAGLTDLLATVPLAAIDALPEPQRDALAAATLRRAPGDETVDPRAISTGVATLLSTLAAERPVVVAIDDVQWLDRASVAALEFGVRRAPVGLLTTPRGTAAAVPVASASPATLVGVTLGPLTVGALHHVILDQLGHAFIRPALVRVAQASGGNPLYALELARAMERSGDLRRPGAPLPLPESLHDLTVGRVAVLDHAARRTLLHAALASKPTLELLRAVGAVEGVEDAERAGLVAVVRGRVELTHPLLADAALEVAAPPERRAAHAALAAAVDDDELRARHLALAATEPTDDVAAALDRAVGLTRARGATVTAAELARLALEHTPDPLGAAGLARTAVLAQLSFEAGDASRATTRASASKATSPTSSSVRSESRGGSCQRLARPWSRSTAEPRHGRLSRSRARSRCSGTPAPMCGASPATSPRRSVSSPTSSSSASTRSADRRTARDSLGAGVAP